MLYSVGLLLTLLFLIKRRVLIGYDMRQNSIMLAVSVHLKL